MGYMLSLIIALLASHAVTAAVTAGERTSLRDAPAAVRGKKNSGQSAMKAARLTAATPLDRVATAVDGAESSHGNDVSMWRADPSGPQGPMQVSEAAATDVGGGDRFDLTQNRALGRAYLAQLYWRYRNWPDAIAAYNWGVGKMDTWIKAGRPADQLLSGVAVYLSRVLHDSGLCDGSKATRSHPPEGGVQPREIGIVEEPVQLPTDSLIRAACSTSVVWGGGIVPSRFSRKLDEALQLALQHASGSQHLTLAPDDRLATPWMANRLPSRVNKSATNAW